MAADRDVRDRERQGEVEDDEAEHRARERPGRAILEHEERAHDPVDRARGADRRLQRSAEQECTGRAREARDEVDQEEPPGPERLLDDGSEPVEGEHVEREVEQARVQEHGRDHPVPLTVGVDECTDQSAVVEERSPGGRDARPLVDRHHVDEDVDGDERDRRRGVESRHLPARLSDRSLRARPAARRADTSVVGALDPDRGECHALLTDGPAALRARDEGLAVGMAIAVLGVAHRGLAYRRACACRFHSRRGRRGADGHRDRRHTGDVDDLPGAGRRL